MARAFTTSQKTLLRSPNCHVNALATFFLDQGTYRFCDDMAGFDLTDGVNTWLGANALAESTEIRSAQDLAAEQVTILLDGNRMTQAGIQDPARVLRDILGYLYQQRRVDWAYGFRNKTSKDLELIIPAYAGKINSARLIDREMDFGENDSRTVTYLEIILDSLAARYDRATNRTRSHQDQLEFDSTDNFYSHTIDVVANERNIFWGKAAPFAGGSGFPGGSLSGFVGSVARVVSH